MKSFIFKPVAIALILVLFGCSRKESADVSRFVECMDYSQASGSGGQVQFKDENGEVIIDRSINLNNPSKSNVEITILRNMDSGQHIIIKIDQNGNVEKKETRAPTK